MSEMPSSVEGALPTFIVIGAMKSGTSSLWHYLGAHPDVFMTSPKEPRYFNQDGNFELGIEWYRALFVDGAHARARGEASTDYTKAPLRSGVPERMASVVPDARLVYLLRDPIDRIRSQYAFYVRTEGERRPINQAVVEDPRYVDFSRYAFQLELYLEHFDRSQILVLWSEDLKAHRAQTVARALAFIGVDPDVDPVRAVIAKEFNLIDQRRRATWLKGPAVRIASRTPLALLSTDFKTRLKMLTMRRVKPPDTTLTHDVDAQLWARLVEDSVRLETLIGEPPPWLAQRGR